ncbi:MAG TPA: hypothetical protein VG894_07190 [Bauldia sp.]|nr:hypothetical protein [Bauldia sp.]
MNRAGAKQTKGATMLDLILVVLGIVFFAVAIAYTYACEIL